MVEECVVVEMAEKLRLEWSLEKVVWGKRGAFRCRPGGWSSIKVKYHVGLLRKPVSYLTLYWCLNYLSDESVQQSDLLYLPSFRCLSL